MWIAGTDRLAGKLGLVYQDMAGVAAYGPIENLRCELPLKGLVKLQVAIRFNHHRLTPTSEYLAGIGLEHLSPNGQRCYEFDTTDGPVVIPAQLLVVALVGPTTLMRAPLLSPQGPTALMTAYLDDGLVVELTPQRMRKFQEDRWAAVCRMRWILQYPSATSAWCSVYANAVEGCLDIKLPNAEACAKLRGVQFCGKLYVTSVDLLTLSAHEEPYEFAATTTKASVCWSLITNADPLKNATLPQLGYSYTQLTESQWQSVAQQSHVLGKLLSREKRVFDIRDKFEVIREHLATGLAIYQLPASQNLIKLTHILMQGFKKKGIWDEVVGALTSTLEEHAAI